MNKKIMMSAMSIIAALTVMGGATYAQFATTATLTGNTFASGDAELQIAPDNANSPGAYAASIPGFTGTGNVAPGYTEDFKFWLKNTSSSNVELNNIAKFANVGGNGGNSPALRAALLVKFTCTRIGDNVITTAGPYSVTDWAAGQAAVGNLLGGNVAANEAQCVMNVSLPASADNTVSNASVTFDGQFNATQVVAP